ncbi:type II toxin-antitoxin system PemK/MazF family toxin [Pseudidiomarina aquimaris]|uniref:type II toxin-antitoxin system PemK/MazF family toxin n=1 Tax=Pseudidiomarina aquimaris TaxID=641841 RepID=UPI0018E53383|nr:type II toxin-antitoxin system PemK/MazF family toxin [Pseudidiomarina aquimaris]
MYIPDKGDIIQLSFDPSAGREIMKYRPVFVISRKVFNAKTGLAVVAPITSTIRNHPLEVLLSEDNETSGAILLTQLKSVDYNARAVKFVEKAPIHITQRATELAQLILS